MKDNLIVTLDKVYVAAFTAFGAVASYGVIAKGAWWHILTVGICAAIALASHADIKKTTGNEAHQN
jgi:hypothetical protein